MATNDIKDGLNTDRDMAYPSKCETTIVILNSDYKHAYAPLPAFQEGLIKNGFTSNLGAPS